MEIKYIQQQILINRVILSGQYSDLQQAKEMKRWADENEEKLTEYYYHNGLKIVRKNIATLVAIQQALKAEVRRVVATERAKRFYQNSDGN